MAGLRFGSPTRHVRIQGHLLETCYSPVFSAYHRVTDPRRLVQTLHRLDAQDKSPGSNHRPDDFEPVLVETSRLVGES
jgi:hypothetical protein